MELSDAIKSIQMIEDEDELKDALCEIIHYSTPFEDNPPILMDMFLKDLLKYYREYYALEHTDDENDRKTYSSYLADQQ